MSARYEVELQGMDEDLAFTGEADPVALGAVSKTRLKACLKAARDAPEATDEQVPATVNVEVGGETYSFSGLGGSLECYLVMAEESVDVPSLAAALRMVAGEDEEEAAVADEAPPPPARARSGGAPRAVARVPAGPAPVGLSGSFPVRLGVAAAMVAFTVGGVGILKDRKVALWPRAFASAGDRAPAPPPLHGLRREIGNIRVLLGAGQVAEARVRYVFLERAASRLDAARLEAIVGELSDLEAEVLLAPDPGGAS